MVYAIDNAYFIRYIEFLKSLKLGVFSIFLNANPAIFKEKISSVYANVKFGKFGSDMKVSLINDGPITIMLEKSF